MKPIENWNGIESLGNRDYKRLVPGGYICKITKVEDRVGSFCLYIEYDIAEGEFAGHAADCLERNGFTPLKMYKNYGSTDPNATDEKRRKIEGMFKAFVDDIEKSNPGYKWDWNEKGLVGKTVGMVLGEEEYRKMDGTIGTRFRATTRSAQAIRDGKFRIPDKRFLPAENPSAAFTPVSQMGSLDDFGLPF